MTDGSFVIGDTRIVIDEVHHHGPEAKGLADAVLARLNAGAPDGWQFTTDPDKRGRDGYLWAGPVGKPEPEPPRRRRRRR